MRSPTKFHEDRESFTEKTAENGTSSNRVARGIGKIGKVSGALVKGVVSRFNPLKLKNAIVGENVD